MTGQLDEYNTRGLRLQLKPFDHFNNGISSSEKGNG